MADDARTELPATKGSKGTGMRLVVPHKFDARSWCAGFWSGKDGIYRLGIKHIYSDHFARIRAAGGTVVDVEVFVTDDGQWAHEEPMRFTWDEFEQWVAPFSTT